MKKIIYNIILFNILLLIFPLINLNSQWIIQNDPHTNSLLDVSFINQNTGWASGDGGVIIKTTNSGTNWFIQNSGTGNILEGIHAVDSQYAYVVGWWNTVLKTTNGGNNWITIRNGTSSSLISFYGIYFLNRTTGWLLRNEYILRTHDGGNTFDSAYINESYIRDIYFKDSLNGILCGDGAVIFKSIDGGVSWNQITIPVYNFGYPDFYKESFIENYGWVIGRGPDYDLGCLCWRTTNFGSSWDTIVRVPYPNGTENYCVFFSSLNTGWCGGTYGHIFKTTDGGYKWFEQQVPIDGFRNSFWFNNDSSGWVIGGGGYILHTTDGGYFIPGNILFCDNFENGIGSWKIDSISGCPWNIRLITSRYELPTSAYGNCLAADAGLCVPSFGSVSTATSLTINCLNQKDVYGEFDNDWNTWNNSPQDTAKVQASYDGGTSWSDVLIMTYPPNEICHKIFQLPGATNNPNLKIRFYSFQPIGSSNYWWAIDNFCVKGYDLIGIKNNHKNAANSFKLLQNFPNPFNPVTTIDYEIPKTSYIKIFIYDILGNEIKELVNQNLQPGTYEVEWNASNFASGIYFCILSVNNKIIDTKKLVLLK